MLSVSMYILYLFLKNKRKLIRSPCCLCVDLSIIYSLPVWCILYQRKVDEVLHRIPFYSLTQSLCNMFAASGIYLLHVTLSDILHAACFKWNVSVSARVQQWGRVQRVPSSAGLYTAHQSTMATRSSSMEVKLPAILK